MDGMKCMRCEVDGMMRRLDVHEVSLCPESGTASCAGRSADKTDESRYGEQISYSFYKKGAGGGDRFGVSFTCKYLCVSL